MKLKIEEREIGSIKPYENNPRINDNAVDAVATSIREFGFRVPIIVDADDVIVAGHTRWKAARKLELPKVPVHVARDLSPEQIRALRIADNKTAELASWDFDLLPIELSALQDADFDLNLIGFDPDELTRIMGEGDLVQGETDPDAIPEPPDEAISKRGEIYVLGDHRLMCGDSSSAEDLDILLDGNQIHLVNMDPPYNVKVEPRSNNAIAAGNSSFQQTHHQKLDLARHPEKAKGTHAKMRAKDRPLENDFVTDEEFDRLLRAWFGNVARVMIPGGNFYIWGGYSNCANYPSALKECELYFSQAIIWVKGHPVMTRKCFLGDHEWCFFGWRIGAAHRWFGPNNARDVWEVKKVSPQKMIHLTEKPVELAVRAIQYSSREGENVLDLFGGSGSTLMGCEQTGRRAFLMELDPLYCDVIRKRYAEFKAGAGCDWVALTEAKACAKA